MISDKLLINVSSYTLPYYQILLYYMMTEGLKVNYLMTYIVNKGREIYETFPWSSDLT